MNGGDSGTGSEARRRGLCAADDPPIRPGGGKVPEADLLRYVPGSAVPHTPGGVDIVG